MSTYKDKLEDRCEVLAKKLKIAIEALKSIDRLPQDKYSGSEAAIALWEIHNIKGEFDG